MTSTRALLLLAAAGGLALGCGDGTTFGPTDSAESSASGAGGGSSSSGDGATTSDNGGNTSSGSGSGSAQGGGAPALPCPTDALAPGVHQRNIVHGGDDRSYELQVPQSYDNLSAVPLLFDLHGYTGDKDQQESYSGFSALAESEGFAVVRPNGTGSLRSWNAGTLCCGTAAYGGVDDVGLMKAIAADVATALCVDPRRIYATGLSNGGAMAHRLACDAADVFAAVAPVSWPIALSPMSDCVPSRPIAVMHAHGTDDWIVPYDGGYGKPSTPESFAYWGAADGCSGAPVVTFTQGNSHCDTYDSCGGGVKVTLCTIDGGHILYDNSDGVPIAETSWQFLSQFALPAGE